MTDQALAQLIKSIIAMLANPKVKELKTCTIELSRNPWARYLDEPRLKSTIINYVLDTGDLGKVELRIRKLSYSHGVAEVRIGKCIIPFIIEYGLRIKVRANPQYIDISKCTSININVDTDLKCIELVE